MLLGHLRAIRTASHMVLPREMSLHFFLSSLSIPNVTYSIDKTKPFKPFQRIKGL